MSNMFAQLVKENRIPSVVPDVKLDSNINKELQNIKDLDDKISNHRYLQSLIIDKNKELPISISDTEFVESLPKDLQQLISELDSELCGSFINSQGQHSNTYFLAKKKGYKLLVVEKDSFGPLIVRYTSFNGNWVHYYG